MRNVYQRYANDYLSWDDVEMITLRGADPTSARQIAYGRRNETKRGRVPILSETVVADRVEWHLPDWLLDGVEPQIGDRIYVDAEADITSESEVWLVDEAKKVRFGTEWITTATRFGPAGATNNFLRHRVNILKVETSSKDSDTGAATESTVTVKEDVPCWVRPATAIESTAWFQEASVAGYLVYFDYDPQIDTPHVLLWGDRYLMVQGYARNVDGLDTIWIVPCLG